MLESHRFSECTDKTIAVEFSGKKYTWVCKVEGDNRGEGLFSLPLNCFMALFFTKGEGQRSKFSQDKLREILGRRRGVYEKVMHACI